MRRVSTNKTVRFIIISLPFKTKAISFFFFFPVLLALKQPTEIAFHSPNHFTLLPRWLNLEEVLVSHLRREITS